MDEIGLLLKNAREANGVSIEEASNDLKIKDIVLINIEEGNIGCFKDIFTLQNYIFEYAKYLGLDTEQIENDFNDYLFEYTSKIPKKKIEKAIKYKKRIEKYDERVCSPYTKSKEENKAMNLYVFYSLVVLGIVIVVFVLIKAIFFS